MTNIVIHRKAVKESLSRSKKKHGIDSTFRVCGEEHQTDDDHNWLDMEIIRYVPNAASTYYQQQIGI